ncbi:prolyl oligopeptidase family serine peptidase [Candidatus Sumerlaeota bacterium]|nr:prolyl oligopeptidase family serine peptidase [Candidatus Sumerlaeota bacterium]
MGARKGELSKGQNPQSFETEIRKKVHLDYLLYIPEDYETSGKSFPLLMFLHGAGERGNDLEKLKLHGPPMLVAKKGKSFPFIIVSPQCPEEGWWDKDIEILTLNALLDHIISQYRIDEDRVYLTGLSMGGHGTWRLAMEYPERFAAIAPICGGGNPQKAERIRHLPVWVFHGAKDTVVPLKRSEEMVEALEKLDADVRFTVYPDADHDSWSETYDNPELYQWFLEYKRRRNK